MNKQVERLTRKEIKSGLKQLPDNWQLMFKRMYKPQPYYYIDENSEASINDIVDKMPSDKLDRALTQIENSIDKLKLK